MTHIEKYQILLSNYPMPPAQFEASQAVFLSYVYNLTLQNCCIAKAKHNSIIQIHFTNIHTNLAQSRASSCKLTFTKLSVKFILDLWI